MKGLVAFGCFWGAVALAAVLPISDARGAVVMPVSATASSSFDVRTPNKTIDDSGLAAGLHDNNPNNMWLTNINLPSNDPWIIYDLGANHNLTAFHVWNYNEGSPAHQRQRGVRDVEILTSNTASPSPNDWVSRGTFTFQQAPGANNYGGQTVGFRFDDVRLVKLDVATNWAMPAGATYPTSGGGDYNYVTGLSEIRFYEGTPWLFFDTFDNTLPYSSYSSDYGLNQELVSRQTPAEPPIPYVRVAGYANRFQVNRVNPSDGLMPAPGKLILFGDSTQPHITAALNNDFLRNVELTVTVDPVVDDIQSDDWIAFALRGQGIAIDHGNLSRATNAGVVFGMRSNGHWWVNQNGVPNYLLSTAPVAPNADGTFDLALTVEDDLFFAAVNGVPLDLDPGGAGMGLTLTGAADGLSNFISFGTFFGADSFGVQNGLKGFTIDNLSIVPEPGTVALTAMGLLVGLLFRFPRRRRLPHGGDRA